MRENKKDELHYQEKHHIKPKCLGGVDDEDNLIYLYGQEHYYAHKLLAEENPHNKGLLFAWWNMCHCNCKKRDIIVSADDYALSRLSFSLLMLLNFSGENAYWYGKSQSEESNKKRSEKLSGGKNPMYGKNHPNSVIQKMIKNRTGKNMGSSHPKSKEVKCIETGHIFDTCTEAALWAKLKSRSSITLCCKGYKESAGKHPETKEKLHWSYVNDGNED